MSGTTLAEEEAVAGTIPVEEEVVAATTGVEEEVVEEEMVAATTLHRPPVLPMRPALPQWPRTLLQPMPQPLVTGSRSESMISTTGSPTWMASSTVWTTSSTASEISWRVLVGSFSKWGIT